MTTRPIGRLKRYPPGLRQPIHGHGAAHVSLVLAGGFEEEAGRGDVEAGAGCVGLRPAGLRHAVRFGPAGAIILTCAAPVCGEGAPPIDEPAWSGVLPRERLRQLTPLLLAGDADAVEASWDLIALAAAPAPSPRRADGWIAAVRDRLLEAPGDVRLSDLAARAGRHRVHLGRAFLAAFGETPSVFRRRAMLDRALCLAATGVPAVQAALDAGFADQSHFSRACRDAFGLAPGRLLSPAVRSAT